MDFERFSSDVGIARHCYRTARMRSHGAPFEETWPAFLILGLYRKATENTTGRRLRLGYQCCIMRAGEEHPGNKASREAAIGRHMRHINQIRRVMEECKNGDTSRARYYVKRLLQFDGVFESQSIIDFAAAHLGFLKPTALHGMVDLNNDEVVEDY